jgi:LmbE family N-acetylglucosaminyl deacetylase
MLKATGFDKTAARLSVLCLGAHCDDIEIGCGGTVLRILSEHPDAEFHWVVLSAHGDRGREAGESAEAFLAGAKDPTVALEEFRDGFFPYVGYDIKEYFERLKTHVQPDVVFTHYRHDLHQDHRLVNELTWNTFRDHFVLEYEVLKYDGDLGIPNYFVPIEGALAARKVDLVWQHFQSQRARDWFTKENLLAAMRVRAVECRAPDGFAEAFHCRKIVW